MYQRRDFYRHARYVHGWLSAFAFIVLIFFAVTGLILNHPEWFTPATDENTETITLPENVLTQIKGQENPSTQIVDYLRQHHAVIGRYKSGEVMDNEVMIHLASPAGSTDIWVTLDNGQAEITLKPASTVSLISDLHRGKNAGKAWTWLIDISAIIITILSLAGYILFLSIKTRLKTHLFLTVFSLALLMLLVWTVV
ncbi:PepSY-associated TM helix domain-containing protein [Acinetobacter guillouiae]|uniref:PepSY-associated TM helix domain-containing protein n=1 Tax=Acinetobacter TaxID=469 RepID=UPI0002CE703D|nr:MULTISPECIES: PepSY-associated TM helix domain-containing protein [Acinetobacter]MDN5417732.1 PepSY-associated TM helix domain-containing protein [Acinetobacter sp.]ENU59404.1 hypothetical protein F981_01502 [Acinetobacter guillouiae CIP 63.46]EPH32295.1 PepSY-associated TM helix domain protein [Acinetobacter guillouiae MSP4-18]KAB0628261.1 hypothetical protein F7P82_06705 [Acinetobacter guillouiae]MCU4492484.1 PepSY-associated TM helix domain-containing protein [Acinetobacter guillouiae]